MAAVYYAKFVEIFCCSFWTHIYAEVLLLTYHFWFYYPRDEVEYDFSYTINYNHAYENQNNHVK